jgi:hypothetical protein
MVRFIKIPNTSLEVIVVKQQSKLLFLILAIFVFYSSSVAIAENKMPIKRSKIDFGEIKGGILRLNSADWKTNYRYIQSVKTTIQTNDDVRKDIEIKDKLISLLKYSHDNRKQFISNSINLGESEKKAEERFYNIYIKNGYVGYILMLTNLIYQYQDSKTIPLIISTDAYYPSDEISLNNYYIFNKKALDDFINVSRNGTNTERACSLSRLSEWVKVSTENTTKGKIVLDQGDLTKIKNRFIEDKRNAQANEIYYLNQGLYNLAKAKVDIGDKKIINKCIKESLADRAGGLRKQAAEYLGEIGDASDIPDLEKLSNDNYLDPSVEWRRKEQLKKSVKIEASTYPVRVAAKAAIKKLKEKNGSK